MAAFKALLIQEPPLYSLVGKPFCICLGLNSKVKEGVNEFPLHVAQNDWRSRDTTTKIKSITNQHNNKGLASLRGQICFPSKLTDYLFHLCWFLIENNKEK